MLSINYTATRSSFRKFFDDYNEQFRKIKPSKPDKNGKIKMLDDKSRMLRSHHLDVMHRMMECFSMQLQEWKLFPLDEKSYLPPFYINRYILAKKMDCSEKTISNYLTRLYKAGFVLERKFRGSTHKFSLVLNSELFSFVDGNIPVFIKNEEIIPIEKKTGSVIKNALVEIELKRSKLSSEGQRINELVDPEIMGFKEEEKKRLQHREESSTLKKKFIIKGCSNVNYQKDNESIQPFKGTTTMQEGIVLNSNPSRRRISTDLLVRSPLQNDYSSFFADYHQFQHVASELMNLMLKTIFEKFHYHAPGQLWGIVDFLVSELDGLNAKQIEQKTVELTYRVIAAWNYVNAKKGRFIPLNTSDYLNPKNENGFIRTKTWYVKHKDQEIRLSENRKIASTVMQASQEFIRVCINGNQKKDMNSLCEGLALSEDLSQKLKQAFFQLLK